MINDSEITDWVRRFIVETFLSETEVHELSNSDDLLKILDSLQILRTIVAIEQSFHIQIAHSELSPENLQTVDKIANFVTQKLSAAGCSQEKTGTCD